MPVQLILDLDYQSDTRWRWKLSAPKGRFLEDFEVALDSAGRRFRERAAPLDGKRSAGPCPDRLLAQFLARLEDDDRTLSVLKANWEDFLKRLTGERGEPKKRVGAAPKGRSRSHGGA